MTIGIIELNDLGIQVSCDDEIVVTSPGCALINNGELLVGTDALKLIRLLPSWTSNHFWNNLNTNPIPNARDSIRHNADLAFAHLELIWEEIRGRVDRVVFVVPSFYNRTSLSLLLGMAEECGIPTAGVVDLSIAASCTQNLRDVSLYLDIHLHRITLTRLSNSLNLSRTNHVTVCETGMATLLDRWANAITKQFIQVKRYDPLHDAKSEQALYDQLPDWMQSFETKRNSLFNLDLDGLTQSVSISVDQLMPACAPLYPQIIQAIRKQASMNETSTLFLSHRFNGVPGIKDTLNLLEKIELIELPSNAAIAGTFKHVDKIISEGGAITHVVNLPIKAASNLEETITTNQATHLLYGNHATAIGRVFKLAEDISGGLTQDTSNPICSIYPKGSSVYVDIHRANKIKINDVPAAEQTALKPGDTISLGDHTMTVISAN